MRRVVAKALPNPIKPARGLEEMDAFVVQRANEVLERQSKRRGLRRLTPFLGPAFIAAIAYIDPGNFATNIAGGAQFGYMLLWVVLVANLMAMLIPTLSAKLGIATGKNLHEPIRRHFRSRAAVDF